MPRSQLSSLRAFIRETLIKEYGIGASGSDPTVVKGFYDYDVERGTDVHSFWYRSPGRPQGGDGDFRPQDAAAYIGMKQPAPVSDESAETTEEVPQDGSEPPEEPPV